MAKLQAEFPDVRFRAEDTFGLMRFKSNPKPVSFKDGEEWVQRYNDDGVALWTVDINYVLMDDTGLPEASGSATITFASGERGQVFESGELPFEGAGRQAFIPGLITYEPTVKVWNGEPKISLEMFALDGVFDTPQGKNTKEPSKNAAPQPANTKA